MVESVVIVHTDLHIIGSNNEPLFSSDEFAASNGNDYRLKEVSGFPLVVIVDHDLSIVESH